MFTHHNVPEGSCTLCLYKLHELAPSGNIVVIAILIVVNNNSNNNNNNNSNSDNNNNINNIK